eukprot:gene5810-8016_t
MANSNSLFKSTAFVAAIALCVGSVGPLPISSSMAATSIETKYDNFSPYYDYLNSGLITNGLGIDKFRDTAAEFVKGDVIEFAVGTGLQLDHYNWNEIRSFTGFDNSEGMLELARKRSESIEKSFDKTRFIISDATNVNNINNGKFDTIVDTFSMCVFDEPDEVIQQMKRLLKPSGSIVLLENSRSSLPILGWIQDLLEPIVTPLSKGCKWNRSIPDLAKQFGLKNVFYQDSQFGTIILGVYQIK